MGVLEGTRKALFVLEHMINEGKSAADAMFSQSGGKKKSRSKKRSMRRRNKSKGRKNSRRKLNKSRRRYRRKLK